MSTYHLDEYSEKVRFRWVYDEHYETRGSYACETEEETKQAEDREIESLNSGRFVALGCIVELRCEPNCHCPACPVWYDSDALWGIVIEPDHDKLREFALESMEYPKSA